MRRFLMQQLKHFISQNHRIAYAEHETEVELEIGIATNTEMDEVESMDTVTMELVDQMAIEISEANQEDENESKTKGKTVANKSYQKKEENSGKNMEDLVKRKDHAFAHVCYMAPYMYMLLQNIIVQINFNKICQKR